MQTSENSRRYKQEWIIQLIENYFDKYPEGKISKEKLLAEFMLKTSSARRTGLEVLRALETMKRIKVDGDLITK